MRISTVNSVSNVVPSFQAKIIDGHAHLGAWGNNNYGLDKLDIFVKSPIDVNVNGVKSRDTITKMIVSSAYVLNNHGNSADEISGNEQMLKMIEGRKEYIPLAVCQPNKTNGDTSKIEELFNKKPKVFKGLKFHATALPLANDNDFMKAYEPYINFAQKRKLPCFFHCQGGQADAWKIYELAQKAPKLPIILGHSGAIDQEGRINRENAIKVFEDALKTKKANIYMDLSWVDWTEQGFPSKKQPDIKRILKIAHDNKGLNKVIFGTDAPLGCFGEWESPHFDNRTCYSNTVSNLKKTISDMFGKDAGKVNHKIFYSNAENLYSNPLKNHIKKFGLAASGLVVATGIKLSSLLIYAEKKKPNINKLIRNKKESGAAVFNCRPSLIQLFKQPTVRIYCKSPRPTIQ